MSSSSKPQPPSDLMEALLKDPMKRALILQLLTQEKDNIEKYKKQELKTRTTPLKKSRKIHCESPTALQRRRALQEQANQDSGSSSSEYSETATQVEGPELPFEQLLKGVRAYVEVKRDNVDRSEGIKAVMKLMGATIRETFTNDVTHVIFKDGAFTTYEKARLMKIHLVSVLWLDAIRRHNARVPEKNYPAFGSRVCDANVSVLCSQIQKDYEDVIKDEKRRRHSMMTPKTSISSYLSAQNLPLSESPEVTSDDSDCGMVNGHTSKRSKDVDLLQASPALTDDLSISSNKKRDSGSPDSVSLVSRVSARNKRKTINVVSNMSLTPNIETNSASVVDATPQQGSKSKKVLQDSTLQSSTMSSLRVSTDTEKTRSGLVGKENCSVITVHSSMSSLRLSEGSEKRRSKSASTQPEDKEVETFMKQTKADSVNSSASVESDKSEESSTKSRKKVRRALLQTPPKSETKRLTEAGTPNLRRSRRASSVALFAKDKSPTVTRSGKKATRPLPETSESEVEANDNFKKPASSSSRRSRSGVVSPAKKTRVEAPPAEGRTLRSRRASSVASSSSGQKTRVETPPTGGRKSRSRRASVEADDNFKKPASVDRSTSRSRRSVSVTSARVELERLPIASSVASSSSRRSVSAGRRNRSVSVASVRDPTPSPPKKTRVEESGGKKMRKLYNPNDVTGFSPIEEDKERREYIKQKSQKSPDGVFLNPNSIRISPSKRKPENSEVSNWSDESGSKEVIKTKKGKKVRSPPPRDSVADEQRELLELLEDAERDQVRRSGRLSLSQTKPKYHFSSESDTLSTSSLPIVPVKRRSTLDFVPLTQSQQKRKLKLDPKRTSSIVCTKMHSYEVVNFENIVSRLGRFFVEDNVTGKTTHLVVGEPKRTINMLRAIARGCWILKHEWLLKSAEEGRWLNEEDYECTEFSPAVQQCRLQREAFGPLYSMDIFKDCGYVYVGKGTTPKTSDLRELISICKGKVTNVCRNASISVGECFDREGLKCVTEKWVLDSITFNKLKSVKNYLIKSVAQDSPNF